MEEQTDINRLQDWFKQRMNRFKRMRTLMKSGKKPIIHTFYTDELLIVEHGKVNLYWRASSFHYLEIDNGVGNVTDRDKIIVKLAPNVKSFTITAYGGLKKVSKTIQIEPLSFHEHKMPMAITHEPQMQIKLPKLQANHSESKGKGSKFQPKKKQGIPQLSVRLPNKPQAVELEKLRSELKEAFKAKEVAALESHLAQLKKTDLLEKLNDINYDDTSDIKR